MKNLQIILSLILVAQMSNTEAAQFTRLFFNNADCSGFHIAYNYLNSDAAPTTCASGCTEWSAGKFWVKEICGTRVSPLFQEGFSVVRNSPGDTCTDDYSEFGALAETCILWEKSPSLKSIKMKTCPGGPDQNLMIKGYNGDSCVLETSTTGYSRSCTTYSGRQGAYSVPQCPLTALPPAAPVAPPVTPPVAPPVTPPVTPIAPPVVPIAAPVKAPVTPPVAPIASPVAPVTPPVAPIAAPVGSPISAPVNSPIEVPVASEAPVASDVPVTPPTSVPSSGSEPFGAAPSSVKQPVSSITKVSSATKSLHYAVTVVFTSILICIGLL